MKTSIGRIVIFRGHASNGSNQHPAVINRAWTDECVNVCVLPDCGPPINYTSVPLIDPESDVAFGWYWPPRV